MGRCRCGSGTDGGLGDGGSGSAEALLSDAGEIGGEATSRSTPMISTTTLSVSEVHKFLQHVHVIRAADSRGSARLPALNFASMRARASVLRLSLK